MNKLRVLLSAGAVLGLVAGTAHASRILDMDGNPATVTGTGLVTGVDGFQEMGGPYTGGQGLETESAVPWSVPQPGKLNMRVNLFVNEFPMATWWTGMSGAPGNLSGAAALTGNKQQPYGIYGWIRLDFGIDAMTKNGIKYGAYAQIRENNTTNIGGGTASLSGLSSSNTTTGLAGSSVNSGFAQSASADSSDNTLYVRHANVYIGTDQIGFLRIGTGLGSQTLYEVGLFDDFDIGGWISFASTNIPSNVAPVWPWADEGGYYMAARVQYVSPVFNGFDFGVGFAPNNSTPFDGSGCSAGGGGVGCATQEASTLAGDYGTRYRNEVDAAIRYRNTFGPIGLATSFTWTKSGVVNNSAPSPTQYYNGLDVGDAGLYVSLMNQVELGGNIMWGAVNGNWTLKPAGGKNAFAWVTGVKWTIPQIPMTVGTYYFNYKYQGTTAGPFFSTRTSQGVDVGAVYGFGPGVVAVAEYAWGQVYQGGVDILTNTPSAAYNTVNANVFTVGMSVRF
ncbi:MAG TPA: hypothetical protein VMB73_26210 [Acetobacteraceae bacterium]|nr:hypothetical protein [Acetobacteraceae bacterium]